MRREGKKEEGRNKRRKEGHPVANKPGNVHEEHMNIALQP